VVKLRHDCEDQALAQVRHALDECERSVIIDRQRGGTTSPKVRQVAEPKAVRQKV
jgi:hypothetical protein